MLKLYYTPLVIAFYIYKIGFNEKDKLNLLNNIFYYEKAFIHPKYQNDKKIFFKQILDITDYFYFKDDLDNENESIQKQMDDLGYEYTEKVLSKKPPLNFFFIKIRLQILFNNKDYVKIKLRTLLKNYGYKKKSKKIINHLEKCMYFYHVQAFKANEKIDLYSTDIDDMITFKINDKYDML